MRLCTTFVFQGQTPLTLDTLEALEQAERRKTIGQLCNTLRQRVELRVDFESLLANFLEQRNRLIHRTFDIPGWNLRTAEGRTVAKSFADGVLVQANSLLYVFAGLVRAWQTRSGLGGPPIPPDAEDFFTTLDRHYVPLIDALVAAKDPS